MTSAITVGVNPVLFADLVAVARHGAGVVLTDGSVASSVSQTSRPTPAGHRMEADRKVALCRIRRCWFLGGTSPV
jgi:hypothetical protein